VGEITSIASVPAGDYEVTLALGYIRREAFHPSKPTAGLPGAPAAASASELRIGDSIGKIEPLPFAI